MPENDPASLYRAMPDRQIMLKASGIRHQDKMNGKPRLNALRSSSAKN
jgi:hypothetical protein